MGTVGRHVLVVCVMVILGVVIPSAGRDWPHWRGPFFDGSTDETNLPAAWSDTDGLKWKTEMPGDGYSTPIVVHGRVFLTAQIAGTQKHAAMAIRAANGEVLWTKEIGTDSRRFPRNIMATPSPASDGKRVVFLFGNGDFLATDLDGKILWQRNLEREYGNIGLKFGYGSSPTCFAGKVYVPLIRRDEAWREPRSDEPLKSLLLAFDPATGDILFEAERATDAQDESMDSYCSPIPWGKPGGDEILLLGADYLTGHSPETGRELWRYEYVTEKIRIGRHIPSAVPGDGTVFGVVSRGGPMFALRPAHEGRLEMGDLVWTYDGPTPDSTTPLYYKGHLYVLDGRKKVLTCLDPGTGHVQWQGELDARSPFYASPTGADDKLYLIDESGHFFVVAADPGEFRVLFDKELGEKQTISTIPAVDGCVYIRTARNLYCIGE